MSSIGRMAMPNLLENERIELGVMCDLQHAGGFEQRFQPRQNFAARQLARQEAATTEEIVASLAFVAQRNVIGFAGRDAQRDADQLACIASSDEVSVSIATRPAS